MDFSNSPSVATRTLAFYETLLTALPVKTQSDRTCFRRLSQWLGAEVRAGRYTEGIFEQVLLYAREVEGPGVINPCALFMSIVRKEIGYAGKKP